MRKLTFIFTLLLSFATSANVDEVWKQLVDSKGSVKNYPKVIEVLVRNNMYFTSVPYIKEYLFQSNRKMSKGMDLLIDDVVANVGVKQFEILPEKALENSNSQTLKYILAKKYFRKRQYKSSLATLKGTIGRNHPVKPFALFLEAAIFSINKKYATSIKAYEECIDSSDSLISRTSDVRRQNQYRINRDYCVVGRARANFAWGKYDEANLAYLDLSKSSYIWPEILFEEAWNSFYLKNYNRTLGKLVTYKAPVLDYIFNPESDVLRGLTYMELCLWDDVKKVVNEFYGTYERDTQTLESLYKRTGRNYKSYYLLAKSFKEGKSRNNKLLNQVLSNITRDPAYLEMFNAFQNGNDEINKVNGTRRKALKRILTINLRDTLIVQRNLIGAYVRKTVAQYLRQLKTSFEDMSYMKLEVLTQRKKELYLDERVSEKRGDLKNLKRTDKQYFWSFNGEFWADELGDYVFSLKSECRE
ncbi:hypothetical protein HBN50_04910 [Halobacteriovorax sp. GB3]|uniref:hypothetical protein n=1 Tax=Halobacteriovorax sp. GB3 TaxID=2719615 RepID=UPI00235E4DFD|nr:hypothetical protein [Halobacteriovorax sp. GB3]MDD0852424.1 hypothetical protein [Halobacteriovorax sp. GB3]